MLGLFWFRYRTNFCWYIFSEHITYVNTFSYHLYKTKQLDEKHKPIAATQSKTNNMHFRRKNVCVPNCYRIRKFVILSTSLILCYNECLRIRIISFNNDTKKPQYTTEVNVSSVCKT